jgi:putative transcriptional regulator
VPIAAEAGHLLVATPPLVDPNFDRTVVLLLQHGALGSIGVVLNRPSGLDVPDSLDRWRDVLADPPVLFAGGPVEQDGIIGLGRSGTGAIVTIDLTGDPPDTDLVDGTLRLFRGYAGWGPDQLDSELADGAWLIVAFDAADTTTSRAEGLWRSVLARQGGRLAWLATYPDDIRAN